MESQRLNGSVFVNLPQDFNMVKSLDEGLLKPKRFSIHFPL